MSWTVAQDSSEAEKETEGLMEVNRKPDDAAPSTDAKSCPKLHTREQLEAGQPNHRVVKWSCELCTFLNPTEARVCGMCSTSRKGDESQVVDNIKPFKGMIGLAKGNDKSANGSGSVTACGGRARSTDGCFANRPVVETVELVGT